MIIIYCILSLILGGLIIYFILKPKIKERKEYNLEIERLNNDLIGKQQELLQKQNELNEEISNLNNEYTSLIKDIDHLKDKKQTLDDSYEQANKNAELYCQKANDLASEKFAQSAERMAQQYQQAEDDYKQEYLKIIEETSKQYELTISKKQEELKLILNKLEDAKAKQNTIIEANKRAEEVKQKEQFYKLNLSEQDIEEIKKIRSIIPYLRSAEPINKVIWKVYYEKPYTDLIGRVIGQGIHTGIYKITNIENQKCYVGQAVNIGR